MALVDMSEGHHSVASHSAPLDIALILAGTI